MADIAEFDGAGAGGQPMPGAMAVTLGWLGAGMSIVLVAGLGVWGYQLAMRDVTGVPVVRALEGPMRVQPDDPGGSQAAHQGLAVNSVAADGSAERPADRLVLAPAPLDLEEEDLPRPVLAEAAPTPEIIPEVVADVGPVAVAVEPLTEETAASLADTLAAGVQPLEVAPDADGALSEVEQVINPISPEIGGVTLSPVPRARPEGDVTALAIATDMALAVARPSGEVEAATVPPGTRLVQFGAYDTPELARTAWEGLEGKFGDFLAGKQRVVQEAVSGGKTFYRLRAMGFVDINDARRFCAALVADRQACIPVVVR